MMTAPTWQDVAEAARKHRDDTIAQIRPPVPEVPAQADLPLDVTAIPGQLLDPREDEITTTPAEELLVALADRSLSSVEVVNAFLRRAAIAQKLVNCVTELLPERALARAKYLDEYLAVNKRPFGPLHGLPISVKEHIGMKGLDLNAGFVSWVGKVADEDAGLLKILWDAGCVFYVRTTQPQTLMHLEASTNLYGTTVNPFNRNLTSGGSSGGEGALLGLRGSCLGIGTDIGGSIRSPAANNGLYGMRPTTYRLPISGLAMTMAGEEHIVCVIGPLSPSIEAIKLFMKVVIAAKPWLSEPSLLPLPWRDNVSYLKRNSNNKRRLKVAVEWSDGVVKPHPPVIRALREVTEKLRGVDGIEVVDWKPYKHDLAWEIIASLYFADGAQEEIDAIEASGEPWRALSRFIIKENPHVKHLSISELWEWTRKRDQYRTDYARVWNETATATGPDGEPDRLVDVVLCPVGPGAAPPLEHSRYWGYTAQWNLLDYPCLVFPVTKADPAIDVKDEGYRPINEKDQYNHNLYVPGMYQDAPVSLQLVGRRYEDEKVIEALEYIKSEIGLPFANFLT